MTFLNRTAVVTGAGGGIGRAVCKLLYRHGVQIAACDITGEAAQKCVDELSPVPGVKAKAYAMDITSKEGVVKAKNEILEDFGNIDILINNGGVWKNHPFLETSEEDWHNIIEINLCGTMRVTQAFLPEMVKRKYGRIINLGSIAGEVGLRNFSDYAASKGGVILFTKSLAMEFAGEGITVNCVSPGMVNGNDGPPVATNGTWLGRTGTREEMAELIAFLAADNAGYITGVDYTIDGGRILGPKQ